MVKLITAVWDHWPRNSSFLPSSLSYPPWHYRLQNYQLLQVTSYVIWAFWPRVKRNPLRAANFKLRDQNITTRKRFWSVSRYICVDKDINKQIGWNYFLFHGLKCLVVEDRTLTLLQSRKAIFVFSGLHWNYNLGENSYDTELNFDQLDCLKS